MKEGIIKDAYELILKEIQTILSIAYLSMVGIGMLFNYFKYSKFGINIFQYADIFDFLIAPFEDRSIFLFTLISALIPYILYRIDIFWKEKHPKSYAIASLGFSKKAWYESMRVFTFALVFIVYVLMAADIYSIQEKNSIKDKPKITLKYVDNQLKSGIQIGKTKSVIFLLEGDQVIAIPYNSVIKEIIISKDHIEEKNN